MSAKAVTWAWGQKVFPGAAILLQCLADESDDSGNCGVNNVSVLAKKCCVSARAIHRHLLFLKKTNRLIVIRQFTSRGFQTESKYKLNLNRASDLSYGSGMPTAIRNQKRTGSDRMACRHDNSSGRTVSIAAPAKSSVRPPSLGYERVAGRTVTGTAKLSEGSDNMSEEHTKAVVVCINNTTTVKSSGSREDLISRLQTEMCLNNKQSEKVCDEYDEPHILSVILYVTNRYLQKAVGKGKIAPYFLSVLRQATAETLGLKKSILDEVLDTPAVARAEKRLSDDELKIENTRQQIRIEIQALEKKYEISEDSIKEELTAKYIEYTKVENPVLFNSLMHSEYGLSGICKNKTSLAYRMFFYWLHETRSERERLDSAEVSIGRY